MSIDTEAPIKTKSALELKSTSFSVPVLVITSPELQQIEHQLEEKIALAPEFFNNTPLLIDLQDCHQHGHSLDLIGLIQYLQSKRLFPVGICGGNDEQNSQALEINIPVHTLHGTNPNNSSSTHKIEKKPVEESIKEPSIEPAELLAPRVENMLISQPIRSGQRIYARGDLIILSHVSAGAEVMAEGNIHIYGALRGKALAGVLGNTESRIFCSTLEAELISIAGHYKISEELEKNENHKATQIYLQNQALVFKHL